MTETYDPYTNAVAERINWRLKQEFIGENRNIELKIMKELVRDSVGFYNNIGLHYSCYMNTPKYMHQQNEIKNVQKPQKKNTSKHVFAGM
jgi:putative transposase